MKVNFKILTLALLLSSLFPISFSTSNTRIQFVPIAPIVTVTNPIISRVFFGPATTLPGGFFPDYDDEYYIARKKAENFALILSIISYALMSTIFLLVIKIISFRNPIKVYLTVLIPVLFASLLVKLLHPNFLIDAGFLSTRSELRFFLMSQIFFALIPILIIQLLLGLVIKKNTKR